MKKHLINIFLKFRGLWLTRWLTAKDSKIFMYHSFSKEQKTGYLSSHEFERQIKLIKAHFVPLTLLEFTHLKEQRSLPKNSVVLTVDDGYFNFYDIAYPILKKHGVPATFFVTTGFIDGKLWLWPDKLKYLIGKNKFVGDMELDGAIFVFCGDKNRDWSMLNDHCLSISEDHKNIFIAALEKELEIKLPKIPPDDFKPCNWEQLKEMEQNGVEIGGHTVTHPSLGQVSLEQANQEIKDCYEHLSSELGEKGRTFCYPNGQPSDYNSEIIDILKSSKFLSAVTAFPDIHLDSKEYSWRRMNGALEFALFKRCLFGLEFLGMKITKQQRCDY
jgi:peptidoglycan/xylan/chitin deacetylase (PgdA/CDA1 family)